MNTVTARDEPDPMSVTMRVNGRQHTLVLDPRVSLLEALREHLGHTGSRQGCDRGQCGECTVLVDGRPVYSCIALAVAQGGCHIATVESVAEATLYPGPDARVHHDALQCGLLTPSQVMSTVALIDEARAGAAADADTVEEL